MHRFPVVQVAKLCAEAQGSASICHSCKELALCFICATPFSLGWKLYRLLVQFLNANDQKGPAKTEPNKCSGRPRQMHFQFELIVSAPRSSEASDASLKIGSGSSDLSENVLWLTLAVVPPESAGDADRATKL